MSSLIVKLGATGDVVRTTALLRRLQGPVTWLTARPNEVLLRGFPENMGELRVVLPEDCRSLRGESFDLVVNLEDDDQTAQVLKSVRWRRLFGAHSSESGQMVYTNDSSQWFDMSLISVHGRKRAD